jgi:Mn2+/Fe2+ NRAMP family transporter
MTVLGSTTIYGLSWLTILVFPMLATIQVIGAQVGVVAKQGLQGAVRDSYGRGWGIILLLSVLAVNVITIGADLEAGAAALGLIFPVAWQWFVVPLAVGMLLVLILGSYASIQRILRYVLLVFAAYVISAILAHPAWSKVLHDTIIPPISFSHTYVQGVLALLGTTLTSYAYVWETIQQGEESTPVSELGLAKADAGFGMFFAVSMFWFILISTGATLGIHHQQAQTAQQAAQALVPVAGPIAGDLFAVGLLASSILAVPVLAASSAYILGSELGWRKGLSQELWHARRFYAAITVTMVVAVVVSLIGISPIQLLFIAGVVGGLGTPISLTFLILVAREHRVMDAHRIGKLLMTGGWAITLLIGAVSLFFLWQLIGSKV